MQSRPNKSRPAIQSDSYVSELREFFADWGLHSGSPSNLGAFAEALSTAGSFRDEFTSMTSTVVLCEGGSVPHNALLDLVLTAISGAGVEKTTEADQWAVDAVDEFVGQVIQSLGQRTSEEADSQPDQRNATAAAPKPSLVRGPRPIGVPRPASLTPKPLAPLTWNFQARPRQDVIPASLLEAVPRIKPAPVQMVQRPLETEPLKISPPAITPKSPPAQLAVVKPPPPAKVVSPLQVKANPVVVPVNLPPDHFFRSTMWALSVALAVALLWRHWHPVETADPDQTARTIAATTDKEPTAAAAKPTVSAPASNGGVIIVGGYSPSTAALLEARRQAGLEPSLGTPQAAPKVALPTGMEQVPSFTPSSRAAKSTPGIAALTDPTSVPKPLPEPPKPGTAPPSKSDSPPPPSATQASTIASTSSHRRSPPIPALVPGAPPPVTTAPTAPNKQGAFLVSSGIMSRNLIDSPIPKYPLMASMAGIEGQVILQAVVSRKGDVVATHVLDGHHLLRGAAVNAVKTWHYKPFLIRGKPADTTTVVILEFRLPH